MSLTDAQKAIIAQNKVEMLELDQSLSNLDSKIDQLFDDAPFSVVQSTSKEELKSLITEIKNGTATNNKISRFLDITNTIIDLGEGW